MASFKIIETRERQIGYYLFFDRCFEYENPENIVDVLTKCEEWKNSTVWKYRREGKYELFNISIYFAEKSLDYCITMVEFDSLKEAHRPETDDTISPNLDGKAVCFSE